MAPTANGNEVMSAELEKGVVARPLVHRKVGRRREEERLAIAVVAMARCPGCRHKASEGVVFCVAHRQECRTTRRHAVVEGVEGDSVLHRRVEQHPVA
eukprot:CAMPEP_0198330998 /NCGR_PEP_ID=MMETSP1450-20131203/17286_1 /TAXON_ID=753684 ORGANISM="Madagascaria erythrocladiodes, Strain CCMP3234" /NCGR_SAMPLE_ID=MMETSP1450 /ASSEMBLY_ACC=CAM_ASM_001115 /LENGTH=97 /DNA_ID=CAMNT_0044035341 /DNA_START=636 /DNA_END=929 /DNA_ORIENTATION=-